MKAPDIALLRDGTFAWNSDALNRYATETIVAVGQGTQAELKAPDIIFFLMLARGSLGWRGGSHLFVTLPDGSVGFTFESGQTLEAADAIELANVLREFVRTHPDRANAALPAATRLIEIAESGAISLKTKTDKSSVPSIPPAQNEAKKRTRWRLFG